MKDIILICPPMSISERYGGNVIFEEGSLPPLGIAMLAAFLRQKGFSPYLIDPYILQYSTAQIINRIKELNPKVIGLSVLTSSYHKGLKIAEGIKKEMPDKLIVVGGHHASIMPFEIIKESDVFDFLVYGEGELTITELMEFFKRKGYDKNKILNDIKGLEKIKGIVFRDGKEVIMTKPREPIQDLDSLPYPAYDLLLMHKYHPLPNNYKRTPATHMFNIRGCPFNCSFCSNSAVFGRRIRMPSPEYVIKEIQYLQKNYGIKEISFWDDIMTINKEWIHKLCDLLIDKKIDLTWTCLARVNTVDLEMLKKMKKAGCWNIFYGYESGNQELLDNINKGITLDQIRQVNKWTKEAGIEIRGSFMLGLPGETSAMARKTIDFAIELKPDYAQFSLTTPYPGTDLYKNAHKYGNLNVNFSQYHGWDAVFVPFAYKDREELLKLEREAVRRFYFRPKYILNRLKKLRSLEDIKRYLKGVRFLRGFIK